MRLPLSEMACHTALSVVAALAFFWLWPTRLVWDDSGFVLRYLDNFAAGHFYCFNPTDGPIFGVSGFLHGVLAGLFAWSHALGPENSMFASNFLGLVLLSFLSLRLLAHFAGKTFAIYPAWLVLLGGCPHLVINLKQGLETPLHVAVVLASLLALMAGRSRTTWACCALAVISKLDAVPAAAVIGAFALGRPALARDRVAMRRALRDMALWCLLPLAAWVLFTLVVFGSPLPQSAFAKLYYHAHPKDSWFPFLSGLRELRPLYVAGLVLIALHLAARFKAGRRPDPILFAPLLTGLAVLAAFYFYNPGERMGWYYALPEFLFLLQIVLVVLSTARGIVRKTSALVGLAVIVGLAAASVPVTAKHVRHTLWYLRTCEVERIAMGRWIGERAAPSDTLLTANGLPAWASGLYTIDASGLNSRAATARRLDFGRLVLELKPNWFAKMEPVFEDLQQPQGYALVKSWYNFSGLVGLPAYRVYHRVGGDTLLTNTPLSVENIRTDGNVRRLGGYGGVIASGTRLQLELAPRRGPSLALTVGLMRGDADLDLVGDCLGEDDSMLGRSTLRLDRRDPQDGVNGQTREWRLDLPAGRRARAVVVTSRLSGSNEPCAVTLLDPLLMAVALRHPPPAPVFDKRITFGDGWAPVEPWGRWAVGKTVHLSIDPPAGASRLVFKVASFEGVKSPPRCVVEIDGREVAAFTVSGMPWQWEEHVVALPAHSGTRPLAVTIRFRDLWRAYDGDTWLRALPFAQVRLETGD